MDLFRQDAAKQSLASVMTSPTTAQIFAFPVDRDLVFIRTTARQLEVRDGAAADKFWRTECNRLHGRLQTKGMNGAEIRTEIDRFARAVHAEMQRAAWAEWENNNPRPAA